VKSPLSLERAAVAAALCLTSACLGPKAASNVDLSGPKVAEKPAQVAAQEEVKHSPRAVRAFDDALAKVNEQKGKPDFKAQELAFRRVVEEDGRFAEGWYNLGVLAERQGRVDEAVGHYQRALSEKPTLRQAAENLAVITQNRGDVKGAVRIYHSILDVYPDDAGARARLAEIYRQNGELDRALELAREALMREARTPSAYKVMMRVYVERRQFPAAQLVALKLDEADPERHHVLGLVRLEEGDPVLARVLFKKAVEVAPSYLPSHVALAALALKNEEYAAAEQHLRRVLQADGKNAEALLNLGLALRGQGKPDDALAAYAEAEKVNPKLKALPFVRGVVMAEGKGDPDKALALYRQFVQSAGSDVPGDHPVYERIRQAEELLLKREEAKRAEAEALRQAAELEQAEAAAKAAATPPAPEAQPASGSADTPRPPPPPPGPSADEPRG
jgi:tetratricopeptide (TPR) repeat protein